MNTIHGESLLNVVPDVLFGAGEMADHAVRLLEWNGLSFERIRCFDDNYPAKRHGPAGLPVVGTIDDGVRECASHKYRALIAIGTKGSAFRYALYGRLKQSAVHLVSLAHNDLVIAPGASYGENCIFMSGCTLAKNARLGPICFLSTNAVVEHDAEIGCNVFFGPAVTLGGHVRIGDHAFIGVGAVIGPGVSIGERTLVGAGAVVVKDLPAGSVAFGVPAKVHRLVAEGLDVPTLEELQQLGCAAGFDLPAP